MNRIETIVYNAVRNNTGLKFALRNVYQSIFDLMPRKKDFYAKDTVTIENCFFGFHDISPFSADGSKILVNRSSFDLRMPLPGETLQVGYYGFDNGKPGDFHVMGESAAWNFHKGCRLQWRDNSSVVFNSAVNNNLVSVCRSLDGTERIIGFPIDTLSPNGKLATGFSYERLEMCMPGYGYPYKDNGLTDCYAPSETGLFVIDIEKNTRELAVSLEQLSGQVTEKGNYFHYVTHSEWSKDGRYISFLHRWVDLKEVMKRHTRMMVFDTQTKELIELPSQQSGSHYVWNNRNQIVASCIIDGKSCHVMFDMSDLTLCRPIAADKLNSDGHQSFIGDSMFVTDTYPDKRRMARIFRVNIEDSSTELLVSAYSPKKFQTKIPEIHIACDLHPRVSADGKYLCWDTVTTGKRSIRIMSL